MTTNRKAVLQTMARVQKNYHDTALYTAIIVTLILILQIVAMIKGAGT